MSSQATKPNTTKTSRRALLAGAPAVAAAAMVGGIAVNATAPTVATAGADPIFAAIEAHQDTLRNWFNLAAEVDRRQSAARESHGIKPDRLIHWRDYHIGGTELEDRRDDFIAREIAAPETIEAEYRDAVRRYEQQCCEAAAWSQRVGIADLEARLQAADEAEQAAAHCLAETMPTTVVGIAAVIRYIVEYELEPYSGGTWSLDALRNIADALDALRA